MRLSPRGVLRSAALSATLSLVLVVLVAIASNGLARADVSVRAATVVVTLVGAAALIYAGHVGGRAARRAELERRDIILSAVVGCGCGFVALLLLNMFTVVIYLGQTLDPAWGMLYSVLPWLAAGGVGGWLASRPPRKTRRKRKPKSPTARDGR